MTHITDALNIIKDNRLKAVSFFAIVGDLLIGSAGTFGLLMRPDEVSGGYWPLLAAGLLALAGHLALLIWGKGGEGQAAKVLKNSTSIFLRPLRPRKYPLDFAFFLWVFAGLNYLWSGILLDETSLICVGIFNALASILGWLIPQDTKFCTLNSVQMSSFFFFISTLSTYVSSYMMGDVFLFLSSCAYLICNLILFTVRKESQSAHS